MRTYGYRPPPSQLESGSRSTQREEHNSSIEPSAGPITRFSCLHTYAHAIDDAPNAQGGKVASWPGFSLKGTFLRKHGYVLHPLSLSLSSALELYVALEPSGLRLFTPYDHWHSRCVYFVFESPSLIAAFPLSVTPSSLATMTTRIFPSPPASSLTRPLQIQTPIPIYVLIGEVSLNISVFMYVVNKNLALGPFRISLASVELNTPPHFP